MSTAGATMMAGLAVITLVALATALAGRALSPASKGLVTRWLETASSKTARDWPAIAKMGFGDLFGVARLGTLVIALAVNLLIAAVTAAPSWFGTLEHASSDSFFTLAGHQRLVVALISALLIFLLFAALLAKTGMLLRHFGGAGQGRMLMVLILDAGLTLVVFLVALSLAPQVYYSYYVLIFPDLDTKWVIQPLPNLAEIRALLAPTPAHGLSDLLAGLSLRACLLCSAWPLLLGATAQVWFRLPRLPGKWTFAPLCGLLSGLFFWALAGLVWAT